MVTIRLKAANRYAFLLFTVTNQLRHAVQLASNTQLCTSMTPAWCWVMFRRKRMTKLYFALEFLLPTNPFFVLAFEIWSTSCVHSSEFKPQASRKSTSTVLACCDSEPITLKCRLNPTKMVTFHEKRDLIAFSTAGKACCTSCITALPCSFFLQAICDFVENFRYNIAVPAPKCKKQEKFKKSTLPQNPPTVVYVL
jgi:hypothetical protein